MIALLQRVNSASVYINQESYNNINKGLLIFLGINCNDSIQDIDYLLNKIINLTVNFYKVENNFFGDSVTVAGLLTGQDIINQLKDKDLGDSVWSTYRILNDDQTLTLDDMTLKNISDALKTEFRVSKDSIYEIIQAVSHE